VLAEIAEQIPAFAGARGGEVPGFGLPLGETTAADGAAVPPPFVDAWFVPQGAARWR